MTSNNLNFNLKLDQKLSPQMLQSLKFLQVNHLELQKLINQEIEINPLLEIDQSVQETEEQESEEKSKEEVDWDALFDDDNLPKVKNTEYNRETLDFNPVSPITLQTHLLKQLQMRKTTPKIKELVEYLIDFIDEKGYLTYQDPYKALPIQQNPNIEKRQIELVLANELEQDLSNPNVQEAFHILKYFEPHGIGAKDLQECLLMQLHRKSGDFSIEIQILEHHFNLLKDLKIPSLAQKLNTSVALVQKALKNIGKLNVRPASVYDNQFVHAVIPDVLVQVFDQDIIVSYNNRIIPILNISNHYKNLIKKGNSANKQTKEFIKKKLHSASSLIQSIEQRKSTILKISESLSRKQRDFFLKGPEHLVSMTLEDVALDIKMHISTVSRVVNEKYIQTPYGCYPLKKFFSSKIQNKQGEDISSTTIKTSLKKVIQQEDPLKPLSDDKISKLLQQKNITVARRTVAKYREELKILPARMRKKF